MFKIKNGYKLELQTPETMKLFGRQKSEVLYIIRPNKCFAYLLNVEPGNLVFIKTCITEFDDIIITFINQNGRPLETEDKVHLTLLINK